MTSDATAEFMLEQLRRARSVREVVLEFPKPPAPSLPRELEKDVQAGALEAAALLGVPLFPTDAGAARRASRGRRGAAGPPVGWPDLVGWCPARWGARAGRFLAVEVKRPGERPRPEQLAILSGLASDGGLALWVDDARRFFEALELIREGWWPTVHARCCVLTHPGDGVEFFVAGNLGRPPP